MRTCRKPVWACLQKAAVAELMEQRLQPISDADAAAVSVVLLDPLELTPCWSAMLLL